MMDNNQFTPETLATSIRSLFEQNNFRVEGPIKLNGAEVDMKATSNSDPFAPSIFLEVTVEYVDTEKYGKDATKFLLIRELDPSATLVCVSSKGFSLPVKERATSSRIQALTYEELFSKFAQFGGLLDKVLTKGDIAEEIAALDAIYEEPRFEDTQGKESATQFLTSWRSAIKPTNPWVVIVGDYGTGKTALTKVLLRRWMLDYRQNPSSAIPFRIELRDFTRQFDARGLLHHFLDTNGLAHLSVDFVFNLIRQGRVVLLLDGYDEMAQYMHARERRVCLGALAELAKDGAKGILTSRPNYFTEAEELHLLDALYSALDVEIELEFTRSGLSIIEKEMALDSLLKTQFLERYERILRDLDSEQTKNLVRKALSNDPVGQEVVLRILDMVFRSSDEGAQVSLSGKPVIISYLLEVVEELKRSVNEASSSTPSGELTEWEVYSLIVDKLMLRDYRRAPEITPRARREFLQRLSIQVSLSQSASVTESTFVELVQKVFQTRIRREPVELRQAELDRLFADLRSSSTLTRLPASRSAGWRFSHNSLREYLAAEFLVAALQRKDAKVQRISITDAMKTFVSSLPEIDRQRLLANLADLRLAGSPGDAIGMYLSLTWSASLRLLSSGPDPVHSMITQVFGSPPSLSNVVLNRLNFSYVGARTDLRKSDFSGCTLNDVDFSECELSGSDFSEAVLEGVSFRGADLTNASFQGALLIEVDFTGASLQGCDFRSLADFSGIRNSTGMYDGVLALGYLAFAGALTDDVPAIAISRHHPHYPIAEKIARKLSEQSVRQKRGLVQRGVAKKDQSTAREFLNQLMQSGLVEEVGGRDQIVRPTSDGRGALKAFYEGRSLDRVLYKFFDISEP